MSKNTRNRILLTALAALLLVVVAVGGTVAWLTASTETITNTFSTAGIKITLTETFNTDTNGDEEDDAWVAKMIPGYSYTKDPLVTVEANSEDCYLFVKFEEDNNPVTYLTYTSTLTAANGWTQGDGSEIPANVWYRKVNSSAEDQSWKLLENDTIQVKNNVTNDNMSTATTAKLTYTAYASQLNKSANVEFTAGEAWSNIGK